MPGAYPRRFGKYVLLKPMARGGMGEIYLAAAGDAGFDKFCVIKKIIAERSDRAKAQRFLEGSQLDESKGFSPKDRQYGVIAYGT